MILQVWSPTYFDAHPTSQACVSGELWHIAFGEINDRILVKPDFEGKSNLGGRLKPAFIRNIPK